VFYLWPSNQSPATSTIPAEAYKLTDFRRLICSRDVAIARKWLAGWTICYALSALRLEDLELGVRLKELGLKLIKCPAAVGYHWHPPLP